MKLLYINSNNRIFILPIILSFGNISIAAAHRHPIPQLEGALPLTSFTNEEQSNNIVASSVCNDDLSKYGNPIILPNNINYLNVDYVNTCSNEDKFQMPRATWTIEPSPDNVTTTSIYMFPQGLGNVTYDYDEEMEYGSFRGINIDVEWASKVTEISIVIQTPKDTLKSVSIGEGMSDYVNIIQGFTSLYELQIANTDTCQYQEGCPTCNTLYTRGEVSSIGPTVIADLSSFDYENAGGEDRFGNKSTLPLRVYTRGYSSGSVYNLTITVPFVQEGMDVDILFDQVGNSNINIKGNLNCKEKDENHYSLQCVLNAYQPWGCSNCQNNLFIDGKIVSGTFNVSEISGTEGTESYDINAKAYLNPPDVITLLHCMIMTWNHSIV